MANVHFVEAGKLVAKLDKASGSLYQCVGLGVIDLTYTDGVPCDPKFDLKPILKAQEKEIKVALKDNSTYRVISSLFTKALFKGVKITDDNGKLIGKTELEALVKDDDKTELDKFKSAIATAEKIADKLTGPEKVVAVGLVDNLRKFCC